MARFLVEGGVGPGDAKVKATRKTFRGALRTATKFAKNWGRSVVLDPTKSGGSVLASCQYVSRARKGHARRGRVNTAVCHFNPDGRKLLQKR